MAVHRLFYILIFGSALAVAKKSFVVVTDTTGSMKDEVLILKNHLDIVLKSIQRSAEIENYILVPFADPDVGNPLISPTPEGLLSFLSDIEVNDGKKYDDCPENSLAAVKKALDVGNNHSKIFLFTDAPAKDEEKLRDIQTLCELRHSQVVTFLSGQCSEETGNNINVYYEMAKSCSGSVIVLDITNLRQLKPFRYMKELINTEWTNIKTHAKFMGTKQFNFNVDPYTKDVMVAVSGDRPEIQITKATGENTAVDKIMETKHSFVIRLLQPESGGYVATIRSRGMSLVTFYNLKELNFQYGFSPKRPRNLKETSTMPLPDSSSFLMVQVADSAIDLFLLELQTGDAKIILDLEILDKDNGLYVVQSFFSKNKPFRISIHGREKNTYEVIKGMTMTIVPQIEVTPQKIIPAVEMIEPESTLVDYTTNITLFCKVKGEPKPEIWWEDDAGNTIDSEDALLEIPSVYISYAKIDNATTNTTVYCKCKNFEGSASLSMNLFVHRDFVFEVLQIPADNTFEYGTEGKLYCEAETYPEASINWYHNDSVVEAYENVEIIPEQNMLLIKSMTLDDTGEYRCEVVNDVQKQTFTAVVDISGLEAPSIEISKTEYILKPGDWLEVECNIVKGNPLPTVTWKKVVEDFVDIPEGVSVEDKFLKIPSAKSEHGGTYTCEASNIQGEDSKEVVIKVQYPPKIKNGDEIKTVKVGEPVTLECDVDAIPKAVVHWYMYRDDVINAFDDRHRIDDRHAHRFEARSQDSGIYKCIAENDIGQAERTVTINVFVPPFIEPLDFKTLTIRAGASLLVPCNVSMGNPVPSTRWEFISPKSTVTVLSRATTTKLDLLLRNVTKKDEGTYQCVAENEVAPDNIKFFLRVQQ